ncbi:glycosyltransferase family 4 protein [Chryseobacterium sp.]|uniref:glycosyltransferase family 4 protein n=1 Tax=Chryseobacterium sp. TaxID=1871047 RepID=UPI0012A84589|nr:glycosyltransferase family 4 protein [Chryseobacterium sp.]QFG53735.1 glycosyltransferase family 4 protein [Chryseobacterium sp.]
MTQKDGYPEQGKLRVLEIINLFSSAKIFIGGQFRYFKENGVDMHLICSPDPELDDFAKVQQIKSYEAIELNRQLSPMKDLAALYRICKFIKRNKVNVLIGHQPKGTLLTVLAGRIMGVPKIILFAHGTFYETETGIRKAIFINLERFLSFFSHKIVCVSPFVMQIREELKIDLPGKRVILGSGTCGGIDTRHKYNPELIDIDKLTEIRKSLSIQPEEFIIGFSGRMVRDKGIMELVDAYQILVKKHPHKSIKLLLVGDLEDRDSVEDSYIDIINDDPNIIKTGFIKEGMEYYYPLMSVLVLPSYRDGFGLSLIEASAMEVPVLASDITGCRDAIKENVSGHYIVIEPADIASKIEMYFDQELAATIGKSGRQWVQQHFDHEVIWPHMLEVLQSK